MQRKEDARFDAAEDGCTATAARSASADGRGGAAAPRLDKRTYLDREQGRWKATLRDYGGGLCEVGWAFIPSLKPSKAARGESEESHLHADRAVRRARSRLRQLALASNADHLLTLTYRANITDYKQTSTDLSRFVRGVRSTLPDWVYIAVPERQQRGAWHWHMAVVGRQDVGLLRGCWLNVVEEGNIDVQPPKRGKANRRLAIVTYLGKYLAKGFGEDSRVLNGHRYRASQGIQVPGDAIPIPPEHRGDVHSFVLDHLRARSGSVGHIWLEPQGMAGWACSWK